MFSIFTFKFSKFFPHLKINLLFKTFLFILLFAFVISCKKEDKQAPQVTILKPYRDIELYQADTLIIEAKLKDNKGLKRVRFSIQDDNGISAVPATSQEIAGKEITVSNFLIIDNPNLITGEYTLQVAASDGVNEGKAFLRIKIYAGAKKLKGLFAVTNPGSQSTKLYKADSTLSTLIALNTYNGDFADATLNPNTQQIITIGYATGKIISTDVNSLNEIWSVPSIYGGTMPSFFHINYYENECYVSSYDGFIRNYNQAGIVNGTVTINSGYYPRKALRNEDKLIVEEKLFSGSPRQIAVYYAISGAFMQSTPITFDVCDILYKDSDRYLLFGNDNLQAKMWMYEVNSNGTWEPKTLPSGKINRAIKINSNEFIIAHENAIYKYIYNTNSLITFIAISGSNDIAFDETKKLLFVANGNQIRIYNYQTGNLISTLSCPENIKRIVLWYNKS
jgi:WD40 repeat protein